MKESEMKWKNTTGAGEYASDTGHQCSDVETHWWKYFSDYRQKQWRRELRGLMEKNGVSTQEICDYTGLQYSGDSTVFLSRLPKKRTSYIGIGMALGQGLHTINRWIGKYGMKQQLYVKDICEDLNWIYLINAGAADRDSETNYFKMFDRCADAMYQTYCGLWADYIAHDMDTGQMLTELDAVTFDPDFQGLEAFIADHMDAFKTAYAKPRKMLAQYLELILDHMETGSDGDGRPTLADLRGYLDDSMINYLSGDPRTIHTMDRRRQRHTLSFKHVPKGRNAHISLALALGMTQDEIDHYLILMGFTPLDAVNREEGILINKLSIWEKEHPLQRKLKQHVIDGDETISISEKDAQAAVKEMLHLRQDLDAGNEG